MEPAEPGTTRVEILQAMHDLQRKYGADAVLMEGQLLSQAIRGGSVLEASISVPGLEERDGKHYLGFTLETGIVYNDREVSAAARRVHAWTEIVETTLHKFSALNVSADGLAIRLGYTHKPYDDEADLRTHLHEGHGDPETTTFYLLLADVADLLAKRISAQQLVQRATILVDGAAAELLLPPPSETQ